MARWTWRKAIGHVTVGAVLSTTTAISSALEAGCWNGGGFQYQTQDSLSRPAVTLLSYPFKSAATQQYLLDKGNIAPDKVLQLGDIWGMRFEMRSTAQVGIGKYNLERLDVLLLVDNGKVLTDGWNALPNFDVCSKRVSPALFSIDPAQDGFTVSAAAAGKAYSCIDTARVDDGTPFSESVSERVMWYLAPSTGQCSAEPNSTAGPPVWLSKKTNPHTGEESFCKVCTGIGQPTTTQHVGDGSVWAQLTAPLFQVVQAGLNLDVTYIGNWKEREDIDSMAVQAMEGFVAQIPKVDAGTSQLSALTGLTATNPLGASADLDRIQLLNAGMLSNSGWVGAPVKLGLEIVASTVVRSPQPAEVLYGAMVSFKRCIDELNHAALDAYTIAAGDSLWSIALRNYGSGQYYHALASANALSDVANRLRPGQELKLPDVCNLQGTQTYLVERGQSLWNIAVRTGNRKSFPELVGLNPSDAGRIYPGELIRLPASWRHGT